MLPIHTETKAKCLYEPQQVLFSVVVSYLCTSADGIYFSGVIVKRHHIAGAVYSWYNHPRYGIIL